MAEYKRFNTYVQYSTGKAVRGDLDFPIECRSFDRSYKQAVLSTRPVRLRSQAVLELMLYSTVPTYGVHCPVIPVP